jgi:hypothetical protein
MLSLTPPESAKVKLSAGDGGTTRSLLEYATAISGNSRHDTFDAAFDAPCGGSHIASPSSLGREPALLVILAAA